AHRAARRISLGERAALFELAVAAHDERELHRLRGHAAVFPRRAALALADALELIAIEVADRIRREVEVLVAIRQVCRAARRDLAAVAAPAGVEPFDRGAARDDRLLADAVHDRRRIRRPVHRERELDRDRLGHRAALPRLFLFVLAPEV